MKQLAYTSVIPLGVLQASFLFRFSFVCLSIIPGAFSDTNTCVSHVALKSILQVLVLYARSRQVHETNLPRPSKTLSCQKITLVIFALSEASFTIWMAYGRERCGTISSSAI